MSFIVYQNIRWWIISLANEKLLLSESKRSINLDAIHMSSTLFALSVTVNCFAFTWIFIALGFASQVMIFTMPYYLFQTSWACAIWNEYAPVSLMVFRHVHSIVNAIHTFINDIYCECIALLYFLFFVPWQHTADDVKWGTNFALNQFALNSCCMKKWTISFVFFQVPQ